MAKASMAMMVQVYDDVVSTGLAVPPKNGKELYQLLEKAIFQDESSDVICVGVKREEEDLEEMPEPPMTKNTKKNTKKTMKSAETSSDEEASDAESEVSSLSDGSTMSKKEVKIAMLTSEYNSLAGEWSHIFPVTTKKGTYEANVAPSKVGELTDAIKGIKAVMRKMAKENKNGEKVELKAQKEAANAEKGAAKEAAKSEKAAAKAAKAQEAAEKKAAKEAAKAAKAQEAAEKKAAKEAAKAAKEAAKAAKAEEAAAKKAAKEAAKVEKAAAKAAKAEEGAAKKAAKAEKAEKKATKEAPKEEATNEDTFEKEWTSNVEEGSNTPKKEVAPKPYIETPGCKYNTEVDHGDCVELDIWDLTQEEDVEFEKRIFVKSTGKYYGVDDEDALYELGGEEAPAVFTMDDVDLVGTWDDEKKVIVLDG